MADLRRLKRVLDEELPKLSDEELEEVLSLIGREMLRRRTPQTPDRG